MRSNNQKIRQILGRISPMTAAAKNIISLGIGGKQWLACVMICAMLLPVFALPVGGSVRYSTSETSGEFEPVNEQLPIWTQTWRDFSAKIEAWTTPLRAENISFGDDDDEKKKKKKKDEKKEVKLEEKTDNGANNEKPNTENPNAKTEEKSVSKTETAKTEKAVTETKPKAKNSIAPTAAKRLVNQLPDNEHNSIYSAENNLGNPPGQTEADSSNQAAALRIRHRAGIANFNFGMPLAALSGRGISAGVGLSYNSRTWNKSVNASNQDHYTYDVEQSWIAPGFSSGFGYLETRATVQYIHPLQSSNFQYHTEIVPLGTVDADGTRHQFLCSSSSPIANSYSYKCNTYSSSDGTIITIPASNWVSNPNNAQIPNTSSYQNTSFIAAYPNGTKVFYSGGFGSGTNRKHYPFMIQDSNGNRIRITYKNDQTGRIDFITDTLNRQIKFYYENDGSGNPDKLVALTIPGMGTSEEIQTVRFYYETMTLNSAGKFVGEITAPATIRVLRYVYMPATKTGYKYDYNTNYGMIKKITRQVGMSGSTTATNQTGTMTEGIFAASTEYDYPDGSTALTDVPKYTKRTDDWQGRTAASPQETFYDEPEAGVSRITVKDNGFDVVTETVASTSDGLLQETSVEKVFGPTGQYTQMMSKAEYTWAGSRNLTMLKATNEAGLVKKTEFEYDQYNNQTRIKEYDYGTTSPTLLRTTEIEYETGTSWINTRLLSLPKSVKTIVGGTTVSKTLYEYDHNGNDSTIVRRDDIDISTHDTFYNPAHPEWTETICPISEGGCVIIHHPGYSGQSAYRGNVTKVTAFSDATLTTDANADVTNYNYDIAGNLVSGTLSCCTLRTYGYEKANEYAFPISQTSGTSPTQLTTSATYNRNTGLMLTATDENSQVTAYEYETDTLRPKKTIYANGGYVQTEYSDKLITNNNDLLPGFVRTTTTLETNKFAQSYSYFNGRGQGIRNATQTPDGWSISAVEYDKLGRPIKSYNPFYASTPTGAIPTNTKFTEVLEYDALGRTISVRLQDNTIVSTAFSDATTTPSGFNKTFVTVTDQAGKQRRQVADSLGRIVRVDEPDTNGNLGAVDAPNQPTSYEYDSNDNLKKVIQLDGTVTQERLFKYDSLSRLTHEKQVEADATLNDAGIKVTSGGLWTKVLKYNTDGLLVDGYDARGINTHFNYDGLNRISSVTYSDGTPTITYTYDQARSGFYNNGTLTRVETADGGTARPDTPATASEFDYDKMSRVVKHRQSIGTQTYTLEYEYNLAGQLTSEKYPSGRTVSMSYDANGRLSNISDASRTYLSNLQYQGNGNSLNSMSLGNGTTQSFGFNDRLQMTNQTLSRSSEVLQKYDYGYGQLDANGNLDTTKNNGQLSQIESHIGTQKQWTQKFSYDSIGRLNEAKEYRGDTNVLSYKQKFDFDRFGNLYRKTASNPTSGQQTPLTFTPIEDSDINKSTNRLATNTSYDDAGNVVQDNKFRLMNFSYDANGRMFKTSNIDNSNQANSVYDASGNRVATKIADVWTFLIYDVGGKMVAEYGGLSANDEGGVKYILQDWQGSSRALISQSGYMQARMDYQAFGEEINSGIGLRTTAQGFGANNNLNQKYALTERDKATGLDHTWFRKHENKAGRWTSPDPYNGSMSVGNPQSFNRYSYVESQPTNYVDPSGLLRIQQCTRTWVDYGDGSGRHYSGWTCVTVFDDGGGDGGHGGAGGSPPNNDTDCERFAKIVEEIAKNAKNAEDFANQMANRFLGVNGATVRELRRSNEVNVGGEFGSSGFKEQFVGAGNQVRHFVGGLIAGYLFGGTGGDWGMWFGEDDPEDIALNAVSTVLGATIVDPTPATTREIGGGARSEMRRTQKIPANPGYTDLADRIRKQVCE